MLVSVSQGQDILKAEKSVRLLDSEKKGSTVNEMVEQADATDETIQDAKAAVQ